MNPAPKLCKVTSRLPPLLCRRGMIGRHDGQRPSHSWDAWMAPSPSSHATSSAVHRCHFPWSEWLPNHDAPLSFGNARSSGNIGRTYWNRSSRSGNMPDSMQICFRTQVFGRPEYVKYLSNGCCVHHGAQFSWQPQTIVLLLVEEFLALGKFDPCKYVDCLALRRSAPMAQAPFPSKNQPASKSSQKQIHLLWYYAMYINVCFHRVPLTCFTAVSIRVPSGRKETYLQLFSQVALFDTIGFPPIWKTNSHLARWSLESKYVGCFPQRGGLVELPGWFPR